MYKKFIVNETGKKFRLSTGEFLVNRPFDVDLLSDGLIESYDLTNCEIINGKVSKVYNNLDSNVYFYQNTDNLRPLLKTNNVFNNMPYISSENNTFELARNSLITTQKTNFIVMTVKGDVAGGFKKLDQSPVFGAVSNEITNKWGNFGQNASFYKNMILKIVKFPEINNELLILCSVKSAIEYDYKNIFSYISGTYAVNKYIYIAAWCTYNRILTYDEIYYNSAAYSQIFGINLEA